MTWRRRREATPAPAVPTRMPETAEQAHATARQFYRAMLHHVDGQRYNMAATSAACFANACALAQMYELRQIRIALLRLAGPGVALAKPPADASWVTSTEDGHDLHPAAPDVPHDGYRVVVPGRRWQ